MAQAAIEDILNVLREVSSQQKAQIELTRTMFELVQADVTARAASVESLREESKQQYDQVRRRQRIQVRIYGLMMAVFGAFFTLQLWTLLKS